MFNLTQNIRLDQVGSIKPSHYTRAILSSKNDEMSQNSAEKNSSHQTEDWGSDRLENKNKNKFYDSSKLLFGRQGLVI